MNPFRKFLLTGALALLGGVTGVILGAELYRAFLPLWSVTSIGQTTEEAVDILFVNYWYLEAIELENNTLYIQTKSGDVYSVVQNNWQPLLPLPNGSTPSQIGLLERSADAPIVAIANNGNAYQMMGDQWELIENWAESVKGIQPTACASEWHLPTTGIIDSAGTVFSHALANEFVCYVLREDGQLQVWTKTRDAFSLMEMSAVSGLAGLVLGFNLLPIVKRLKNRTAKSEHHVK